ncbi:CMGC/SRPK protein kinase [Trichophyton rubrum CBS 735.88]|nr:CMGC/SRPK protein kinase [Trichophyton rubrum CBS 735.88]
MASLELGTRLYYVRPVTRTPLVFPSIRVRSLWTGLWKSKPAPKPPEQPRSRPASGFQTVDAAQLVEEEELPDYKADRFYPVRLGLVFRGRHQVLGKLGFGSSSTVWLARDLKDHLYVMLKVYVHTSAIHREIPVYHHISPHIETATAHRGRLNIRQLLDSFTVAGPDGRHLVLVHRAAQMSLRDMKLVFFPNGFDPAFVRGAIIELLQALDPLHSHAEAVHTDVHSGNMLLGLWDNTLLKNLEDAELRAPVARKPVSDSRTIYLSRLSKPKEGPMLLSDFGEARLGPGPHPGDIMPLEYRAPETLLYVTWSYPVDVWSVGLTAWDLLGLERPFTARDVDGGVYDATHFAQLIAALGPPPPKFLAKNPERRADFWDENGEWLGLADIPEGRTLESLETRLETRDKDAFLRFVRKALTWMPEQRATAKELLQDPWLLGSHKAGS